MEGTLVRLDFTAAFDRASHCGLLYKLKSIGIGRQFAFTVSQFLQYRRQRMRLDGKISLSFDVVAGVLQGSVLGQLLTILYISELFHIVENHMVDMLAILRSMQSFLDRFCVIK